MLDYTNESHTNCKLKYNHTVNLLVSIKARDNTKNSFVLHENWKLSLPPNDRPISVHQ